MEYNNQKIIGTLEPLEQLTLLKASHEFESRTKRCEYIARLHLLNRGRLQQLIWDHDGIVADINNFSFTFKIHNKLLSFNSLSDFSDLMEFEFLLADRYCGLVKIVANSTTYYFCTGSKPGDIEQFVMYFDSIVEGNDYVAFFSKAFKHQAELLISVHEDSSWENEEELQKFSSIFENCIRGDIHYVSERQLK